MTILKNFSLRLFLVGHPPHDNWVNIEIYYYDLDLLTGPFQCSTPLEQLVSNWTGAIFPTPGNMYATDMWIHFPGQHVLGGMWF